MGFNQQNGGFNGIYPLVNIQKTMENHHFLSENHLFLWSFIVNLPIENDDLMGFYGDFNGINGDLSYPLRSTDLYSLIIFIGLIKINIYIYIYIIKINYLQWIGLRENFTGNPWVFTIKYRGFL